MSSFIWLAKFKNYFFLYFALMLDDLFLFHCTFFGKMDQVICFTTKVSLLPHVLHSYHIPDFFFIAAFLTPPLRFFAIHSSLFCIHLYMFFSFKRSCACFGQAFSIPLSLAEYLTGSLVSSNSVDKYLL